MAATLSNGLVISTSGRHCLIEADDGHRLIAHPRGKKNACVVGDRVLWQPTGDEAVIERMVERRNLLYRQDEVRTKSFAANLDRVLLLLAAEPEFSESQLMRALIAAHAAHIPVTVVLNKSDLREPFERAWQRLAPYRAIGEDVLPLTLHGDAHSVEPLQQRLAGRTTLVIGPSGAGKSTLINHLVPDAKAQTGEISHALNSGKHTTTSTTWYWLDAARHGALIDSPGFQEFGLRHLEATELAPLMPDMTPFLGQCKFYNCTHLHEPGCAVQAAVGTAISPQRYRLYGELFNELSQSPY